MSRYNPTLTERFYIAVRLTFIVIGYLPRKIANWATDKLNDSFYRYVVELGVRNLPTPTTTKEGKKV